MQGNFIIDCVVVIQTGKTSLMLAKAFSQIKFYYLEMWLKQHEAIQWRATEAVEEDYNQWRMAARWLLSKLPRKWFTGEFFEGRMARRNPCFVGEKEKGEIEPEICGFAIIDSFH